MNFMFKYVFRNLSGNWKRFTLSILSIVAGTGIILWLLTFNKSGHEDFIVETTKTFTGMAQFVHKDFFADDFTQIRVEKFFTYPGNGLKDMDFVSPRVLFPVYLTAENKSKGTILVGVDEKSEIKNTNLAKALYAGQFVSALSPYNIVIGRRMAKRLDVEVGDTISVFGKAINGAMSFSMFTVRGLLDFGGGELEEKIALTDLQSARVMSSLPQNGMHVLAFFDEKKIEALKSLDNDKFGKLVMWRELLPDLSLSIETMTSSTWLITFVIIFVICFGVCSTFLISLNERDKEYRTLITIGVSHQWIITSIVLEIFILLIFSVFLGNVFALVLNFIFSHFPIPISLFTNGKKILLGGLNLSPLIRFRFYPDYYLISSVIMVVSVLLSSLYPIFRLVKRSKNVV